MGVRTRVYETMNTGAYTCVCTHIGEEHYFVNRVPDMDTLVVARVKTQLQQCIRNVGVHVNA